jgi:3-methyladenine DNA glycosylase AlkD
MTRSASAKASARGIERTMTRLAKPARARVLQSFFKTGPGEYGEGDRFLGLTLPQIRTLAREYRGLEPGDVERLLQSPWHEVRLLAVILLAQAYPRVGARAQTAIFRLYLRRTDRINNWDLVDVSAPAVVGAHLFTRSRRPLRRLARSKNLWERRIAMIATQYFIRRGEFADTIALAESLLGDRHDLIHKAVGWMLREVGKRDEAVLRRFLDRQAARMPRTALRYAIERLPANARRRYLRTRRT